MVTPKPCLGSTPKHWLGNQRRPSLKGRPAPPPLAWQTHYAFWPMQTIRVYRHFVFSAEIQRQKAEYEITLGWIANRRYDHAEPRKPILEDLRSEVSDSRTRCFPQALTRASPVSEGVTAFSSLPAQNQQVTKSLRLRCVTGMCRNSSAFWELGQAKRVRTLIFATIARFDCCRTT